MTTWRSPGCALAPLVWYGARVLVELDCGLDGPSVCSRDNANDRSDVVSVIGCGMPRLVRQGRELLPVKLDPMARSFGRDREAALYFKWLGEVGFKPKTMGFEI